MNELSPNQAVMLRQAIAALEAQRATLGDAVVEASLVALRAQLLQVESVLQKREEISAPRLTTCLVANLVTRDKDPSRGLKILDHGFSLVAETVRLYGGTVQGIRGNYLVALFSGGADDPVRAAQSALDMRQRILDLTVEREREGHSTITFRAGLNIGMVTPGTTVPKGETGPIDVAGVLSQYAPPNMILLSQQFQAYLNGNFTMQTGAIVEIGRRRIPTFRLMDTHQTAIVLRHSVPFGSPFLGRAEEMRIVLKQIEQFGEGQGGVIVVAGESGLGKTRLVTEIRAAAPVIQWLDARCAPTPVKLIYGVWNDLLLHLIGADVFSSARDIDKQLHDWLTEHGISADCYPFLANQLGLALLEDTDPARITRQTIQAWQLVVSAIVEHHPTVFVFEEAQAMDSSSLQLFETLVESTEDLPVVWLLITQPLYNQPAAVTVSRLARHLGTRYTYLGLEPISDDESQSLLLAVLAVQELPDPLQAGVLERSRGNPLFLQQIVRSLIDRRGLVIDPQGRWEATAAALQENMPWDLRDVILQRVRNLPGDAQELLQLATVADAALLSGVLKTLPPNTDNLLDVLRDSGLVAHQPEFCHPAVREIVYQAIAKPQRAAMHRQVAATLAARCELGGPWLRLRAYHMDKGSQQQTALETYEEAKAWAYANNALAEVSEIIGSMLDLLHERDTPEQVASLLVEQQDVLYELNPDDSRCKVLLERAYELWISLGDSSEAAGVLMRMALHHSGTPQEDGYYRDAQSLLEREDPKHPMLSGIYLQRALYVTRQGQMGQPGQAQACNDLFERARMLALALHDVETLARIHFEMGLYRRNTHQLLDSLAAFQQALSYFSQLDDVAPDERILTCNYLADLYYHLGQPADGEYFAVEAANDAPRGSDMVQVLPFITLSECYGAQARWQEAMQVLNEAPAALAPLELPPRFWLGRWQFESGDTLGGLETMREALPLKNLECMMLFVDYLLEAGLGEEASIRLHQMVKQGRFNEPSTTMPTQAFYDRLRGRLASVSKDYNRAIALLDRAMRQFDRDSFLLLAISTRRAYAVALLSRGSLGDDQAARTLMDESIAACKTLSIHAENRRLVDTFRTYWPDSARR